MSGENHEEVKEPAGAAGKEGEAGETAPAPEAASTSEDVERLKARAQERDEFLDLLKRTQAEFINYRRRIERERLEWTDRAVGEFVLKLLPVLDDFDRALAHAGQTTDLRSLVEGVRLTESKIYAVLKAAGVEPYEPRGKPFSPEEHEAVIVQTTDEHPDHAVIEVLHKGYRLHGRVLRPAQVKVARSAAAADATRDPSEGTPAPEGPEKPQAEEKEG